MNWWFDFIIFAVLAFLIYVTFRFEKNSDLATQKKDPFDEPQPGFTFYPARLIRQSGFLPDQVKGLYWSGKLLLALLLPSILLEWSESGISFIAILTAALAGFVSIDIWLLQRRQSRRLAIEQSISFFVDLIVAFLRSGQSLAEAFSQAARYGLPRGNPLTREVALIAQEMAAGRDRQAAFNRLAERTGVADLQRLAAVMNVGLGTGSPVAETLEAQSDLLRTRQWERGAEMVDRKALMALFPMLLVSMPILLVLVFFPAGMELYEAFTMFINAF